MPIARPSLRPFRAAVAAAFLWTAHVALAAPCAGEDFAHSVTGGGECLVIASFGPPVAGPPGTLVVWLHGDHSGGGPATSHVRPARELAGRFASERVLAVAMWRPGYEDAEGHVSGGDLHGRSDHYTEANVAIVADAIARLRAHWQPARTVIVGHSGGAATAAILLGMRPGLVDGALLLSCPCDLRAWRARRAWWPRSEDPMSWATKTQPGTTVLALTGGADDNTAPALARRYVDALAARGVDARFAELPNAGHNSILNDAGVMEALGAMLK